VECPVVNSSPVSVPHPVLPDCSPDPGRHHRGRAGRTGGYQPAATSAGLGIVTIDPSTRPLDTRQPGPQQGKLQSGELM
jgi:hypothetical protein